jgi:hypothetical protein
MRLLPVAIACLAIAASAASAAECESYDFEASAGYSAAKVRKGIGKARFFDGEGVAQPAYLVAGDEVVVLAEVGGKSCAVYVSRKFDETIGWLKSSELVPVKTAEKWKGTFQRDQLGSEAVLKPLKDGRVDVAVSAYWAMSLEAAQNGGINEGGIGGEVTPEGGVIHIDAVPADNNNCEADLRLIGTRYLLIEDNRDRLGDDVLTCAGHNVTFTGLYVRTK